MGGFVADDSKAEFDGTISVCADLAGRDSPHAASANATHTGATSRAARTKNEADGGLTTAGRRGMHR